MKHARHASSAANARLLALLAGLGALLGSGCGDDDEGVELAPLAAPAEQVAALERRIAEVAARPEHDTEVVEVEHVLVGIAGAPQLTGVTRSKEEARALAAELLARAERGESFRALREQHSDDPGEGIYTMTAEPNGEPGASARSVMVQGFGDLAWRLEVGEVGVVPYDPESSPFGWHVVKRIR